MSINFDIHSWRPRHEKKWDHNDDGSLSAEIYTDAGVVSVFTFPGDDRHREFTSLEVYYSGETHLATLPKHYHERWLRRLASEFAYRVMQLKQLI